MKRWLKRLVILLIIVGVGYTLYMRLMPHGGGHGMPGGMMMGPMPVDVATVIEHDVQIWHEFSGRLVAADQADVRPRVSGMIESVLFQDGAHIKKDDPLFKIDPRPYQAAVDQAKGALASAQAQVNLTQREFNRAQKLFKDRTISQRDFDNRKNERDSAAAQLESAKAALEAAQINLDYTDIKAPIDGRVGRVEVTVGNIVQAGPGAPVLTTVVADSPIYADFEMDEASYLKYAHTDNEKMGGIPVMLGLSSEEGTPHTGRIGSFDNRLDPASGTIRVRAVFANEDGALVPGLFARILIGSSAKTKAVLITDKAIGTDQDKKFALAVGNGGMVEYRVIVVGVQVDGLRVIESGLKAGDKIIVNGLQRARPGAPVVPQDVDMVTGQPSGGVPPAQVQP